MTKFHTLVRTHNTTGVKQVCVGSSLISGKPYWAQVAEESTMQPLLFRDKLYAEWHTLTARDKDGDEAKDHSYSTGTASLEV